MTPRIEVRGATKRFPGVLANDHVDFSVEPGEIHALLGEKLGDVVRYLDHGEVGIMVYACPVPMSRAAP